jgi:hypothetical protein
MSDIMVNVDRIGCTVSWGSKRTVGRRRRVGKSTRSGPFRWPGEWVLEKDDDILWSAADDDIVIIIIIIFNQDHNIVADRQMHRSLSFLFCHTERAFERALIEVKSRIPAKFVNTPSYFYPQNSRNRTFARFPSLWRLFYDTDKKKQVMDDVGIYVLLFHAVLAVAGPQDQPSSHIYLHLLCGRQEERFHWGRRRLGSFNHQNAISALLLTIMFIFNLSRT